MEIEIKKFNFSDKDLLNLAYHIRTEVFVKEQNTPVDIEFDEFEEESEYYLLFVNGEAVATSRLRKTAFGIKLERFAVLKPFRKKGLGDAILKQMLSDISDSDLPKYLNSQAVAMKFYERFGFEAVGEMFMEANIEHYKMIFNESQNQ